MGHLLELGTSTQRVLVGLADDTLIGGGLGIGHKERNRLARSEGLCFFVDSAMVLGGR